MIYYLTFNDLPSGIYYSQVTDVCNFLSKKFQVNIRLIAFVSIRLYFSSKKKIKHNYPNALVLPMFPGIKNWKINKYLLQFFVKGDAIIARGPYAACLAIQMKNKHKVKCVCFDARGAYFAEFNEYDVAANVTLTNEMKSIEKFVLENSDYKIAVSDTLIKYWNNQYNYTTDKVVKIPCTLNEQQLNSKLHVEEIKKVRNSISVKPDDILLCYSGSSSGWHSFKMMSDYFNHIFSTNHNVKLLLMTPRLDNFFDLKNEFSDRVIHKWVNPNDVFPFLSACDYGILIREQSLTNKVASPVKFAEYLNAGLKVIVSDELGDYSDFVRQHKCGFIFNENYILNSVSFFEKTEIKKIAHNYFSKESHVNSYKKLINALSTGN